MLEMVEAAKAAALEGARVLREAGCEDRATLSKTSDVDLVTPADIASGVAIVSSLYRAYPSIPVVIEEVEVFGQVDAVPGDLCSGDCWVIDPLDGTTSFVHGYPGYSISVALVRDGVPILGVVHNVPANETCSAARGLGASLDDDPIRVADSQAISESLMMTGFPYDRGCTLERQLAVFAAFMRDIHGMRRDGSAALDLCHVAAGRADGYWEFGLSPWDTAAGLVILEEAGGVVTDVYGEPWRPANNRGIVAANPILHPLMLDVVRANDPDQSSG